MVQFFKVASWDRLLVLLLLFGLMQTPFLLFAQSILTPELLWIRLGERMAAGWRLYAQIADETGPLAALVYAGLAKLNLCDFQIFRIAGSCLILLQAFWFNQMAQRFQLMNERNYLVAFFYLIFCHLGPDGVSLSPILMATTFLLATYNRLFKIIKEGPSSDDAMFLGLNLGLAALFYQPVVLFLIPVYLSCLFYSGLRINQYFLVFVAMVFPSIAVYSFYLVGGGVADFWFCFLAQFRVGFLISWTGWDLTLSFGGILVLTSLLGWVVANQNARANFQQLAIAVFFFGLIGATLTVFLGTIQTTSSLFFLVPFASFFMAQFIQFTRSALTKEITVYLILIVVLSGFFGMSNPGFGKRIFGSSLFVEEPPKGFRANFKGKSILLLSNDFSYYKYNPPATRFFKFYLSQIQKSDSQTMEGLVYWYQCLAEDPPSVIYDPQDFITPLAVRIPEFAGCYSVGFYPSLFVARGRRFGIPKD
ncbi:MAG TPA: hypothetical protein PKY12_01320 [Catalimonadaceae bacterium]|nr:hypothetical protein [Catalimonadaceae bacterium]